MPNSSIIKGIQYVRNDQGGLIPVLPLTTADNVYCDINNKITIQDKLVGGKVTSGTYSYRNVLSSAYNGPSTGVMKVQLPIGLDGLDIDAELTVHGMGSSVPVLSSIYNTTKAFTRNTTNNTVYTKIAEMDYSGRFMFIAVDNSASAYDEYDMFTISGAKVHNTNMISDLGSNPVEAHFDNGNNFFVILCESHIYVYKRINDVYVKTLETTTTQTDGTNSMVISHLNLMTIGEYTYIVATSATSNNIQFYQLSDDGGTLSHYTGFTLSSDYMYDGKIYIYNSLIIILREQSSQYNSNIVYHIDQLQLASSESTEYTVSLDMLSSAYIRKFDLSKYMAHGVVYEDIGDATKLRFKTIAFSEYTNTQNFQLTNTIDIPNTSPIFTTFSSILNVSYTNITRTSNSMDFIISGTSANNQYPLVRIMSTVNTGTYTSARPDVVNNPYFDEPFFTALGHPTNGYVYGVLSTNIFGSVIVPIDYRGLSSSKPNIVELTSSPTILYPPDDIAHVDMRGDGSAIFIANSSSTKIYQHKTGPNTDDYTSSKLTVQLLMNIHDIKYTRNKYFYVSNEKTNTDYIELFADLSDYGASFRAVRDVKINSGTSKLTASGDYKNGDLYSILLAEYISLGQSHSIHVLRLPNVISSTAPAVSVLTVSGVSSLPSAGNRKILICRNAVVNGFYSISTTAIEHYNISITGSTARITMDSSISVGLTNLIIDDAVLCNDDKTIIVRSSSESEAYMQMFYCDLDAQTVTITQYTPTISGCPYTFDGGHGYQIDVTNNELIMFFKNDIVKFSINGTNVSYINKFISLPKFGDYSILRVSADGSKVFATTEYMGTENGVIGSVATEDSFILDYGSVFFSTKNNYVSEKVRVVGHLSTEGWTKYSTTSTDAFLKDNVSLGYDTSTGKGCILIGKTTTPWLDTSISIDNIIIRGLSRDTNYYSTGYSTSLLTSLSNINHITDNVYTETTTYSIRLKTDTVYITKEAWVPNIDYGYSFKYYHSSIRASSTVNVNIEDMRSLNIANIAVVHSISVEHDGFVEIFAAYIPTDTIAVRFDIIN